MSYFSLVILNWFAAVVVFVVVFVVVVDDVVEPLFAVSNL